MLSKVFVYTCMHVTIINEKEQGGIYRRDWKEEMEGKSDVIRLKTPKRK